MQSGINNIFYYNGQQVRSTIQNNKLWFAVVDICRALNIYMWANSKKVRSSQATYGLEWGNEKRVFPESVTGFSKGLAFVNEQGLSKLVANSGKQLVGDLQNWIKLTVLPTIQRPVNPVAPQPQLADDEIILQAITILQNRLKQVIGEQQVKITPITPKAPKSEPQWLTINEWCEKNKINLEFGERFNLGRKAAVVCKREGIEYEKESARYWKSKGRTCTANVKIYPERVIRKAAEILGIETDSVAALNACLFAAE